MSLMGRLKTALNEEKEFTKQLEDHIKYQDDEAEKQRVQEEKMKEEHGAHGDALNKSLEETAESLKKMARSQA